MDLASLKTIRYILAQHHVHAKKYFGQNFLINRGVAKKAAAAANIQPTDVILEIGPGLGALTQELAQTAQRVIAVEKDAAMVKILQDTLAHAKNVEILHGDILEFNTRYKIQDTKYKVVANLPFYLTAPVIRKFLEAVEVKPQQMTLMVQKEVAQRICAKPPDVNLLAVAVQFYAAPMIIAYVKKSSFWPQPKVDAAILQITPFSTNTQVDSRRFFQIVKAAFKQPRKQLLNNLSTGLKLERQATAQWLLENNIQPTQRAQSLTVQDCINLTDSLRRR